MNTIIIKWYKDKYTYLWLEVNTNKYWYNHGLSSIESHSNNYDLLIKVATKKEIINHIEILKGKGYAHIIEFEDLEIPF